MNLIDLLKLPENKTLEFKERISSTQKLAKTVTAFANTSGGIILLGGEENPST